MAWQKAYLLPLIFSGLLLFAFSSNAKVIEVFLDNNVFYAPEVGNYVETDISISGPSINYKLNENGQFQGAVEISLVFSKNNKVVDFEKYVLHSVALADTNNIQLSLIDKKRFSLPENGLYSFDATFKDLNGDHKPYSYTESVIVDFDSSEVQISDIALIDKYEESTEENIYSKSGLYMVPYVIDYYPDNIDKLKFYAEIYNTEKVAESDQFLVVFSIKKLKQDKVIGNLSGYKKISAQPVNVIFSEFDISKLNSGNYNLEVDVKDTKNNLLAVKKLFFQRSNTFEVSSLEDLSKIYIENTFVEPFSLEAMEYHLRTLSPIASADENNMITNLLKDKNEIEMKRFFLHFWTLRNPTAPYDEWQSYAKEVRKVNDNYSSSLLYGFETDRGRIYLQYGPPNQILTSPREPGALPYEIWKYNKLKNQTDVKFVFYNPDLVSNNYQLIHSTAQGETRNEQWQTLVHEPFVGPTSPTENGTQIRKHYGSNATEYYGE